jgi:hypothetical protein
LQNHNIQSDDHYHGDGYIVRHDSIASDFNGICSHAIASHIDGLCSNTLTSNNDSGFVSTWDSKERGYSLDMC